MNQYKLSASLEEHGDDVCSTNIGKICRTNTDFLGPRCSLSRTQYRLFSFEGCHSPTMAALIPKPTQIRLHDLLAWVIFHQRHRIPLTHQTLC